MKLLSTFLLFFLPLFSLSSQDILAKMDEYMNAQVKLKNFSGSILVAKEGKILVSKGYGMADREKNIPCTSQTVFRLGSITKQFTGTAILKLQEQGKLKAQDKVSLYYKESPEAWKDITIHHLLTHTSGIVNYTDFPEFQGLMPNPTTPDSVIKLFRDKPLDFKPGEKYKYSNSGYILLGYVIEKASGVSYADFLQTNFFNPFNLKNIGYEKANDGVQNRAIGYSKFGEMILKAKPLDMSWPYSAGALYSTTEDLYKWEQLVSLKKVISDQSLKQLFREDNGYGYGWMTSETFGKKNYNHAGGINGFITYISKFPAEQATVIVLSNLEGSESGTIGNALSAILLNEKYEIPKERLAVKVDPQVFSSYTGEYQLAPNFTITITTSDEKLFAQATGQPKFEIYPESENKYFLKVVDAQISFIKNPEGKVSHLILHQNGEHKAEKIK